MSVSANIPALGNKVTKDVPDQNALNQRMMRCDFSDVTDLPVGTKELVESAEGWGVQQYNGTGWVLLEKWNIDAQKVGGHSAATGATPNTIPVRDANGKLPGDITGNAATASKAAELSTVNPVSMGGTGATTAEQARNNLGVAPISHALSGTDYGIGTESEYGHTRTHDTPDATLTAASGHAFSPAGAAAMQDVLEGQIDDLAGVVSGNATTQATKDAAQDAAINAKLNKSGGTVTGSLIMDGASSLLCRRTNDDGLLVFRGGSDNTSAQITLTGKNYTSAPGRVVLQAKNDTIVSILIVDPGAGATIDNKPIITSAGGEIGSLHITSPASIFRNVSNGVMNLYGGESSASPGGRIVLYGPDHSDYPGEARLIAKNSTSGTDVNLRVCVDGTGYLGGYKIHTLNSGLLLNSTNVKLYNAYSATLPSGGTWVVIGHSSGSNNDAGICGTYAGGTKVSMSDYGGVKFILALKIA